MRIKISPSMLNSFNRYLDESLEYEDFDRLMENFSTTGKEPSEKMAFGTACHKILENPEGHHYLDGKGYRVRNDPREAAIFGDYMFVSETEAKSLIDFHNSHPGGVYEQRHRKTYYVGQHEVIMSSIIDMIQLGTVHDFKITESKFEADVYMNSYQWRCYLDITGLDLFEYDVFKRQGRHPNKVLELNKMNLYSYPAMHTDIVNMIDRLIAFLSNQNILKNYAY